MGWKVLFGEIHTKETDDDIVRWSDQEVDFDDLPPSAFDDLAADDPTGNWWSVYSFPGENSQRLYKVIRFCAEHAGVTPPAPPTTMRDEAPLIRMLERTPEIADQPHRDGFPQEPDGTETGLSSISSGDTTGDQVKSDESQSET